MTSPHTFDREEVMAYLDGELPPARAAIVRAHVEACESCRALAGDLRAVSARLAEWPVERTPDVLDVTVRAAIDATPLVGPADRKSWRSRWESFVAIPMLRLAGAAAVVAAGVFGLWLVERPFYNEPVTDSVASVPASSPQAVPAPQVARTEPEKPALSEEQNRVPGPTAPSRSSAKVEGGLATGNQSPRLDAVEAVRISPRPVSPPVPTEPPPTQLTKPPLSTVVIDGTATPPPPPPAPPPPAAIVPPQTQTAVTTASGRVLAGSPPAQQGQTSAGRGGAAGAGAAAAAGAGAGGRGTRSEEVVLSSLKANFRAGVDQQIARRVEMAIVASRFDSVRAELDRIVAEHKGMTSILKTSPDGTSPRAIDTVIRIPVDRIRPALASIRELGRVTRDVEASDDVAPQVAGLVAQYDSAMKQETALEGLLARQTGDAQATAATQQASAKAREDRGRIEREILELQIRVANVFVTLRIEESAR